MIRPTDDISKCRILGLCRSDTGLQIAIGNPITKEQETKIVEFAKKVLSETHVPIEEGLD